jgi:uncharacterized protein DUF5666
MDERDDVTGVPAPVGYSAKGRVRGTRRSAAVVAAGAAGLLLIGAAGFTLAATPSGSSDPGASGAPAASPSASPNTDASPNAPDDAPNGGPRRGFGFGPGLRGFARGLGGPGGPGRAFGAIHIKAIDGASVSLATDDGWTRTITVGDGTPITKAGAAITAADLKVGDEVRIAETRAADGSYTITRLEVVLPTSAGQVTAKGADTITIQRFDGTTATIHVGSSTTYRARGNAQASLADVTVGAFVVAVGNARPDGSLDAVEVLTAQVRNVQGHRGLGQPFGPRGNNAPNGPNGPNEQNGPNGQPAPTLQASPSAETNT